MKLRQSSRTDLLTFGACFFSTCFFGIFFFGIFFSAYSFPASASALDEVHGRLQLTAQADAADQDSLDAQLGERYRNDMQGDLRLTWEPRFGNWDVRLHYQLTTEYGDNVTYTQKAAAYTRNTSGDADATAAQSLFDLSTTLRNRGKTQIIHRLDRMALGYSTPDWVVRAGRQALTWGSGKVFQVMDPVAPFAPESIDTEYKPGADMAYLQRLFDDGSDLQLAWVPRSAADDHRLRWDLSTTALYYRHHDGELNSRWLLAHDYDNWTFGAGLSGALGGASWTTEIVPTLNVGGSNKLSALANIDYALLLSGHNTTLFAEYYHNGFGATAHTAYRQLPDALISRLNRGQLFNLYRDYLAGGITFAWTPLLDLSSSLITNLNDRSLFATTGINWSLDDNTTLLSGIQFPIGPRNSEYGGIAISENDQTSIAPGLMAYLQLRHYF